MLKAIGGIILGIIVAVGTTALTDALVHNVVAATPMPTTRGGAAMEAWMAAQPAWAFAVIVAGWALAAFSGAAVASRVAGRIVWPGLVVTGLYLLAVIANFTMLPHPVGFVVAALVLVPIAGGLGARAASGRGARDVRAV